MRDNSSPVLRFCWGAFLIRRDAFVRAHPKVKRSRTRTRTSSKEREAEAEKAAAEERRLALSLLPHLDRLDDHATLLLGTPARQPSRVGLPKVAHGRLAVVSPGFTANGVAALEDQS